MTSSEQYELKILEKAKEFIQEKSLAEILSIKGFIIIPDKSQRYTPTSFKIYFEKNKRNKIISWSDSIE